MLTKELTYGFQKYRAFLFVTILLILLLYRGLIGQQDTQTQLIMGYSGEVPLPQMPGVTWVQVTSPGPGNDPSFESLPAVDGIVVTDGMKYEVYLNPYTLHEAEVYMAVDSLRYTHDYKLEIVSFDQESSDRLLQVQHLAIGFIFTFLCIYLPYYAWRIEGELIWQQFLSPAPNSLILFSKIGVVSLIQFIAWMFYAFLFSISVADLSVLILIGMLLTCVGFSIGVWQHNRIVRAALYCLLPMSIALPNAIAFVVGDPELDYSPMNVAGLIVGIVIGILFALVNMNLRFRQGRVR